MVPCSTNPMLILTMSSGVATSDEKQARMASRWWFQGEVWYNPWTSPSSGCGQTSNVMAMVSRWDRSSVEDPTGKSPSSSGPLARRGLPPKRYLNRSSRMKWRGSEGLGLAPFPLVLDGEVGTAAGGWASGFGPPPPSPRAVLDAPGWARGGTKDGSAAGLTTPLTVHGFKN